MAQLWYLSNRALPDIKLAVSLLCTRVRHPDTDYHKNLERVMKYTKDTIFLLFILSIDKSGNIKWYVDVSFSVKKDTRGHTGGFITMGTGGAYVKSIKKLNTKISNQEELFGVDNILTQVIYTGYFLKEQGYKIHDNVIYQDKQSTIKLENNGRR